MLLVSLPEKIPSYLNAMAVNNSVHIQHALNKIAQKQPAAGTILFLEPGVDQRLVNWNDPFLMSPVILCRDLGQRNQEFPVYAGQSIAYFRKEVNPHGTFYQVEEHLGTNTPGFLSAFSLVLTLEAGSTERNKDIFDICYRSSFVPQHAALHLQFIREYLKPAKDRYQESFRLGIYHVVRSLLLPLAAFEERGVLWKEQFDCEQFREELQMGKDTLRTAGETGRTILEGVEKVEKRIDQDKDGTLSDSEIRKFLSRKLELLMNR